MNPPFAHLSVHRYSGPFLDAISVERSGFKGMRILIEDVLVNDALREAVRIPVAGRRLIPLRRLDHSEYRANGFQDWLWMLPDDEDVWARRRRQMATRLRWAVRDSEEFLQAAATQVVFNECEAIRASLRFDRVHESKDLSNKPFHLPPGPAPSGRSDPPQVNGSVRRAACRPAGW
jgi:hypothetical protein